MKAAARLVGDPSPDATVPARFLAALFAAYDAESVRWVALRNYEGWPAVSGHDIDLVIHRDDLALHDAIVRRLARRFELRVHVRRTRSSHVIHRVLSADSAGCVPGVMLDVCADVVHRGFRYLAGETVLASRRRQGSLAVPAPEVEALALLLHCAVRKREMRPSYRLRLRALAETGGAGLENLAAPVVGVRLARALARMVADGVPEAALALRGRLLWACAWRHPRASLGWVGARLAAAWDRVRHAIRPPGRLVVLLGPDGAGKSTVARLVQERFATTHVPVDRVYLGAQTPLLPTRALSKRIRRLRAGPDAPKRVRDVGRRRRLMGLLHLQADKLARYLVHVRPLLMRGRLVVLDRYLYDYRVFPHPLVGRPWVSALAVRLIPRPGLVFCLGGDPAVIAARKLEMTEAETARHMRCLEGLVRWLPDLRLVRCDGDLDVLVDEVSEGLVRLYAERA